MLNLSKKYLLNKKRFTKRKNLKAIIGMRKILRITKKRNNQFSFILLNYRGIQQ
jgi:hypothetical protein